MSKKRKRSKKISNETFIKIFNITKEDVEIIKSEVLEKYFK